MNLVTSNFCNDVLRQLAVGAPVEFHLPFHFSNPFGLIFGPKGVGFPPSVLVDAADCCGETQPGIGEHNGDDDGDGDGDTTYLLARDVEGWGSCSRAGMVAASMVS